MDEFAERHTREMIVRNARQGGHPSAGVGTCMTKKLHQALSGDPWSGADVGHGDRRLHPWHRGQAVGLQVGIRGRFARGSRTASTSWPPANISRKTLEASIKQKTRWVYGINFEAMRKLGWEGDPGTSISSCVTARA